MPKPRLTHRGRFSSKAKRYYKYCEDLRLLYKDKLPESLSLTFYVTMPKSWTQKKKKAMYDQPHQQRPDLDNYVKAVLDAQSIDDSYIWNICASKRWGKEGLIYIGKLNYE